MLSKDWLYVFLPFQIALCTGYFCFFLRFHRLRGYIVFSTDCNTLALSVVASMHYRAFQWLQASFLLLPVILLGMHVDLHWQFLVLTEFLFDWFRMVPYVKTWVGICSSSISKVHCDVTFLKHYVFVHMKMTTNISLKNIHFEKHFWWKLSPFFLVYACTEN